MRRSCLLLFWTAALIAQPAKNRHVVVISIDGFAASAFRDASLAVPTLRKLARDGAVAEGMTPVNPSVTWPNHTSMVTGVEPAVHGVLYNGLPVRGAPGEALRIDPFVDKSVLVEAPTVYDAAHAVGLTTAEVDWVAIQNAASITWSFAEIPKPDDRIPRELIAAGLMTVDAVKQFRQAPITFRDHIWTEAAVHILIKYKPNLMLFHLLTTDSLQHRHGAGSVAARAALELADARVARLMDALRAAGMLPRTTWVIVSDHGFKSYTKVIRPNVLLKNKNLGGDAWAISEGGTAMVYATRPATKTATLASLRGVFTGVEGITRIVTPGEFAALGYPSPERNERMADLVLAAADGFSFDGSRDGEAVAPVAPNGNTGAHGYLNSDRDMLALFIASGSEIKPGTKLSVIRNLDVAPTLARLLGVELKTAAGHPLSEILK